MLIEHGSVALAYAERGVSRRRVVQGVAWSVPAVLIATAAPAAAASPAVQGGLALTNSSMTVNGSNIFVATTVVYVGDGSPSPDFPVTSMTIEVSIPTARISGENPGVAALDWSYVGKTTSGTNTIFTFRWNGLPLEGSNPAASTVTVRIPAAASLATCNATITGRGLSNGSAITPVSTTVTSVLGADLVIDGAGIEFINWMPGGPNGQNQEGYWFRGSAGRWNGPYYPVGPSIAGLELVIRISAANTDGTYQSTLGTGWTMTKAPTLANGVWEARWTYSGTIGAEPLPQATSGWDVTFKAVGSKQLNAGVMALSGLASGVNSYVAVSGPTS